MNLKPIVILTFFLLLSLLHPLLEAEVIGYSVENRPIHAHTAGEGEETVVIIGGIHGGYEWNTVVLARRVRDYFQDNPDRIPSGYRIEIIPNMNPDGLYTVTGGTPISQLDIGEIHTAPGRFNARGVDLNRNWDDGEWQPTSYWGQTEVDAGEQPFSEPETKAVRDFILRHRPEVVIFFQSAANGIWYGGKQDQWKPAKRLAEAYAAASGYDLPEGTEGPVTYEITGSASGYLYSQGIPTLVIELTTHTDIEFEQNLKGVLAVLELLPPVGRRPNGHPAGRN